ncbi:conserved hypothetical protein [Histoplasma capsulatum G186AR]|uniref:AAA+ ATPase domain-containing protein n=1 Tax=Ajellomyces capsulatus (strain G186AR / H82 / ATCC MYA-2454 / RMSCC 2432) TaxID=447093 RepID=C0NAC5_AJECG|nr:uncharacterized protein HCBG_00071 [Histoplasma capsulatum G186AR]EEH10616.1 conserved hypothetical protein [Histoplasma capsulatum G186AR]
MSAAIHPGPEGSSDVSSNDADGELNGIAAPPTPESERTKSELEAHCDQCQSAPVDNDLKHILKTLADGQKELLARKKSDDDSTKDLAAPKPKDPKDETDLQEIAIKRVSPGDWRKIKKEGKIDLQQSVLLVSSKANARTRLRRQGYKLSRMAEKKPSENTSDPSSDDPKQLDIPFRLAINSTYLLEVLSQFVGESFTAAQNVFVRPFKYLVMYESDIRQFVKDAEMAYDQAASRLGETTQENPVPDVNITSKGAEKKDTKPEQQSPVPVTQVEETNNARTAATRARRERDELRCLVEFMDTDLHDIFEVKRRISNGDITEIAFEHLWLLFKPGDVVLGSSSDDNQSIRQAYRVLNISGGRAYFDSGYKASFVGIIDHIGDSDSENEEKCRDAIKCSGMDTTCFIVDAFYIDFDGTKFGPRSKRFAIPPFKGTKPIRSLIPFPLLPGPESEQIERSLIQRGRRFAELVPGTHKKYSGATVQEGNQTTKGYNNWMIKETELHSEIVVDQAAGVEHFKQKVYRFGRSLKFGSGAIARATPQDKRETFDPLPDQEDGDWVTDVFDDSKFEEDRQNEFRRTTDLLGFRTLQQKPIPNDNLMLFPYRAYGYGLLDHKWLPLDINKVEDLPATGEEVQRARFEDLVLPEGHRMLLQALIKNQVEQPKKETVNPDGTNGPLSMDAVPGKGKGLIILLHGAPGVGKTSTAECVAAQLKRPLLPITCGDIGTTAQTAEATLESFCVLAHRWRCVLLLDEADVFLAKREKGDIIRNSLVSVFLRVLEYYSGVIILTTNRVGEFDEAFRSRIHMSLYYPKLDELSTKEIWEKNLGHIMKNGRDIDVEDEKIRRFANKHWQENKYKPSRRWNGRQIKNAFQTALALANWDFREGKKSAKLKRPLVKASHFMRIAQTSAHFDDYISNIHGIQEEDTYGILAEREEVRKDNYESPSGKQSMQGGRSKRNPPPPRRGINRRNSGLPQGRGYDYEEDDESSEDDIERLKLKLELAKLKSKSTKSDKVESGESSDEDEDEAW